MTSDLPGTTPTEVPDTTLGNRPDAVHDAPAKPPRRRATRKAAAPAAVDAPEAGPAPADADAGRRRRRST